MVDKILRWLIFGVVVSLLPLAAAYATLAIRSQPATLRAVAGNGEVLIICWSLCAGALGELFGSTNRYKRQKMVVGGVTIAVIVFCTLVFAPIEERRLLNQSINEDFLLILSYWALGACILSSMGCLVLSET